MVPVMTSGRCSSSPQLLHEPVIVVSDLPGLREALTRELEGTFPVLATASLADALRKVEIQGACAEVTDLHVGEYLGSGLVLLDTLRARVPRCVRIVVSDRLPAVASALVGIHAAVPIPWQDGKLRSTVEAALSVAEGAAGGW
jgi:hypothetical protein